MKAKPALLSGGNPQVPKGYGDAPVQAYIAAMTGWKRGHRPPPRRPHLPQYPRRSQGGQIQFAALRNRRAALVPRHPCLHEVREGGFLPWHVAAPCPARKVQAERSALPRHPRGRVAQRSPTRRLGETGEQAAGGGDVTWIVRLLKSQFARLAAIANVTTQLGVGFCVQLRRGHALL